MIKKIKILAIDDEQIVLDSMRRILTEENFEVDTTLNGKEGIGWVLRQAYDLVLTDIRMPDISGKIVLREVKRLKPSIPVIIISGYATVQSALQCMQLGAAHVLEKPFTPEELLYTVQIVLDQASQNPAEEQGLIHEEEIRKILDTVSNNPEFAEEFKMKHADALEKYNLTAAEKLALLTGDVEWFEQYMGMLDERYKNVLALNF